MLWRLVVGLGNPGRRYARTRHNIGFMVADALAREAGAGPWTIRCRSLVSGASIGGTPLILAKPLTYMNLSGHAVRLLLEEQGGCADSLVLVLDDLNLPFGGIRVRPRGSAGGHHGLQSVIDALGNDVFVRVRVGISEEEMPGDKTAFVLSDFPADREDGLREMILRAASAVRVIISDGVDKAMSAFNA